MFHQLFHIFGLQEGGNGNAGLHGEKPHRILFGTVSAFAPENVRGLTFTAPNSETGSNRNQTGKSVQIKCRKTLTALWRKAAWFCGFKLTNTIYKFKQVEK